VFESDLKEGQFSESAYLNSVSLFSANKDGSLFLEIHSNVNNKRLEFILFKVLLEPLRIILLSSGDISYAGRVAKGYHTR